MCGLQLAVQTTRPTLAEAVFEAQGAQAITLSSAGAEPQDEPEPDAAACWPTSRVVGLFAADIDPEPVIAALTAALELDRPAVETKLIEDRNWVDAWREDYRPMCFGQRLWVSPAGEPPPEAGVVVLLEPGLAFGTGTHPTTALCLEWLDRMDLAGATVIDYGCGSGILAVAAAKLGAERVWATDIDPQALRATADNAARNRAQERLEVCTTEAMPTIQAQTLLANIVAGSLLELAPRFAELIGPGGHLVLSGVLDRQYPELQAAYASDFEIRIGAERQGWLRLEARRRGRYAATVK